MDTYGGSLTDPMSLHKYLFANSNPVMYCDPSGHSSLTLGEAMGVCAIIGALSGAFLYDLGFLRNENETKNIGGYLTYAIVGAIIAILIFLVIYLIAKIILFIIALASTQPDKVDQAIQKIDEFAEGARGNSGEDLYKSGEAFRSIQNGNGGTIWVSIRQVWQSDVASLFEKLGDANVKIISGIHGFQGEPNYWEEYAEAFAKDQDLFGKDIVYNFVEIIDDADILASLLETNGDTILAWCYSEEIGETLLNRLLYG
jgi:hypothetical protein